MFKRGNKSGEQDFVRTGAQDLPRPQLGNFNRPDGYSSINLGMNFKGNNDITSTPPNKSGTGAGIQQNLLPDSHRHKNGLSKLARRVGAVVIIIILAFAVVVLVQSVSNGQ